MHDVASSVAGWHPWSSDAAGAVHPDHAEGLERGPATTDLHRVRPSGPISGAEVIRGPYKEECSGDSVVLFWTIWGDSRPPEIGPLDDPFDDLRSVRIYALVYRHGR